MKIITILLALAVSVNALASECSHLYPDNKPIVIPGTVELCSSFFVVLYNPTMKAAILASEVISATASRPTRVGGFMADPRLAENQRATNSDYRRSGYDKGHVVPAADANTVKQIKETFRLSNTTPQVPSLNRESWRDMEHDIRERVAGTVDTWVVTGALYDPNPHMIGANKIPVPSGYYKIAYLSSGTLSFYAANKAEARVQKMPVGEINAVARIGLIK